VGACVCRHSLIQWENVILGNGERLLIVFLDCSIQEVEAHTNHNVLDAARRLFMFLNWLLLDGYGLPGGS